MNLDFFAEFKIYNTTLMEGKDDIEYWQAKNLK